MSKIILISGKAEAGKTSAANLIKEKAEILGLRVMIIPLGAYVKTVCREHFGWDGAKDEIGRSVLQRIGTNVARRNNPNIWLKVVRETIKAFRTEFDIFIVDDVRFKNELAAFGNENWDIYKIRVERPGHESKLTPEQRLHPSETDLDEGKFGYYLRATDLFELQNAVDVFFGVSRVFEKGGDEIDD